MKNRAVLKCFYQRVSIALQGELVKPPSGHDFDIVAHDVTDSRAYKSPELDKLEKRLQSGDELHVNSFTDLGVNLETVFNRLLNLTQNKVVVLDCSTDGDESISTRKSAAKLLGRLATLNKRRDKESRLETCYKNQGKAVLKNDRLKRAISIANEHWVDKVPADKLAEKYGLSIVTIYRYVKKYSPRKQAEMSAGGDKTT